MKDKFSEFIGGEVAKPDPHITNGAFDCQKCDEYVKEAYYDHEKNELYWFCSNKHRSNIGEFYK